jgi:hypothetical protein
MALKRTKYNLCTKYNVIKFESSIHRYLNISVHSMLPSLNSIAESDSALKTPKIEIMVSVFGLVVLSIVLRLYLVSTCT